MRPPGVARSKQRHFGMSPDHPQARWHRNKNVHQYQAGTVTDVARRSGPPRRARRMGYTSYQNCANWTEVIGTNSSSCETIRLLPRISCRHCRVQPSTIAATSTRKKTATIAPNRQTLARIVRTKGARVDDAVAQCSDHRCKMFDKRSWDVYEARNK